MPSEVIRCSDCGAVFKGIPTWLTNAKVKFSCTNCPKRPSRGVTRFEPLGGSLAASGSEDEELDGVSLEELDEDTELEEGLEDLEDKEL